MWPLLNVVCEGLGWRPSLFVSLSLSLSLSCPNRCHAKGRPFSLIERDRCTLELSLAFEGGHGGPWVRCSTGREGPTEGQSGPADAGGGLKMTQSDSMVQKPSGQIEFYCLETRHD